MKRILYLKLFIAGLILLSVPAGAQFNLGIATSNWSGTQGVYLNPANIADSRTHLSIDLLGVNAGIENNLGSINKQGGLINTLNNSDLSNLFNYSSSSTFSLLAPYAQVSLPGFMYSFNNKHSIALTTSINGFNQFNNFDQTLFRTIADPTYLPNGNLDLTSSKFNYTAQLWSQIGVTYAGVLYDKGEHEIKFGVTVRYLGGLGYIGLKGKNLDVHYKDGNDTVNATNSDLEFASNVISTKSALFNGVSNSSLLSQFFGAKDGSGIGGDIGVVYDFNPYWMEDHNRETYDMDGKTGVVDGSKNRYLLRFSASVMDLGAITYKGNANSNAEITGNGYITGKGLSDHISNFDDFRSYIVTQGFTADTAHIKTKVHMPTTLRLSGDYHAYKWFYVNAAFMGNLANRQDFGNSYYNQFSITPRYDTRTFSVGLPVIYSALDKKVKLGIGARVSGFFIGSDDMLGFVSKHPQSLNFYFGGSIPFYKIRPKDKDNDHVSDKKDKCPDDFGTWENKGCPDPKADKEDKQDVE